MGYVIPSGFSRVTIGLRGPSLEGSLPSFGFGLARDPDELLLNAVGAWVLSDLLSELGNGWYVRNVEVRSDDAVLELPIELPGTVSAAQSSPQVAALYKLVSGVPGRANRGRVYFPGVLTDDQVRDDGSITPARLGQLEGLIAQLDSALAAADSPDWVILHSTALAPTLVTGRSFQGQTATIRRRNRR